MRDPYSLGMLEDLMKEEKPSNKSTSETAREEKTISENQKPLENKTFNTFRPLANPPISSRPKTDSMAVKKPIPSYRSPLPEREGSTNIPFEMHPKSNNSTDKQLQIIVESWLSTNVPIMLEQIVAKHFKNYDR